MILWSVAPSPAFYRGEVLDAPSYDCFYVQTNSVHETLYIHVLFNNGKQDISCSLTTSYEDLLLSTEPFQQSIPLAVCSLRYTFLFRYGDISCENNDWMVGYAYAGDGGFFSGFLAWGRSLWLDDR